MRMLSLLKNIYFYCHNYNSTVLIRDKTNKNSLCVTEMNLMMKSDSLSTLIYILESHHVFPVLWTKK